MKYKTIEEAFDAGYENGFADGVNSYHEESFSDKCEELMDKAKEENINVVMGWQVDGDKEGTATGSVLVCGDVDMIMDSMCRIIQQIAIKTNVSTNSLLLSMEACMNED